MNPFWNSPTYRLVKAMKANGNAPGLVERWRQHVEAWAMRSTSPDAEAVRAWLPLWQTRAIYSATELAPIIPALIAAFGYGKTMGRLPRQLAPARLANELRMAGLPERHVTFGDIHFAVERLHYWRDAPTIEWERELLRGAGNV